MVSDRKYRIIFRGLFVEELTWKIFTINNFRTLASINAVDDALKELVSELSNLSRDTIIIVTSDNGGNNLSGACNYPYRGSKTQLYEARV